MPVPVKVFDRTEPHCKVILIRHTHSIKTQMLVDANHDLTKVKGNLNDNTKLSERGIEDANSLCKYLKEYITRQHVDEIYDINKQNQYQNKKFDITVYSINESRCIDTIKGFVTDNNMKINLVKDNSELPDFYNLAKECNKNKTTKIVIFVGNHFELHNVLDKYGFSSKMFPAMQLGSTSVFDVVENEIMLHALNDCSCIQLGKYSKVFDYPCYWNNAKK